MRIRVVCKTDNYQEIQTKKENMMNVLTILHIDLVYMKCTNIENKVIISQF